VVNPGLTVSVPTTCFPVEKRDPFFGLGLRTRASSVLRTLITRFLTSPRLTMPRFRVSIFLSLACSRLAFIPLSFAGLTSRADLEFCLAISAVRSDTIAPIASIPPVSNGLVVVPASSNVFYE